MIPQTGHIARPAFDPQPSADSERHREQHFAFHAVADEHQLPLAHVDSPTEPRERQVAHAAVDSLFLGERGAPWTVFCTMSLLRLEAIRDSWAHTSPLAIPQRRHILFHGPCN